MKGIELSAINVVLHPHSSEIYEKWLRRIFKARLRGHVHGSRYGVISQLYRTGEEEGITLHGTVSTFIHFNQNRPWYNEKTADNATREDLGEISLPEYLRPDHRRGAFAFDSKRHLFIFESNPRRGGLTPRLMLHLLEQFSKDSKIESEYGPARLTVIPDARAVEEILETDRLKKLVISTSLPNPDFADAAFQDVAHWLSSQGAETFKQELASSSPDLKPSEETKNLARIAAEHGYVEATGVGENNKVIKYSTKSAKPFVHADEYDQEVEPETNALVRIASFVSRVIARRRRSVGPTRGG